MEDTIKPVKKRKRKYQTFLGEVKSMTSTGMYGYFTIQQVDNVKIHIRNWNLTEKEHKLMLRKWMFIQVQTRDSKYYFSYAFEAKKEIVDVLKVDVWKKQQDSLVSKRK